QLDLEAGQRDQAEQHQGQRHHRDADAAPGGELDQVESACGCGFVRAHQLAACAAAAWAGALPATSAGGSRSSTCTAVPSRSAALPATTTASPSARPSRTSTQPPSL